MLTHEQIWTAIDRLAATHGYSTSGLARRAGLDPTTFNRSKRFSSDGKERWPSTESIAKVLAVTGASMATFVTLMAQPEEATSHPLIAGPRYLPLVSLNDKVAVDRLEKDPTGNQARNNGAEFLFPDPRREGGHALLALRVEDDRYLPVYRAGDVLVVAKDSSLTAGYRAVVQNRDGALLIGDVLRMTATRLDLAPIVGVTGPLEIPLDHVAWMGRLVWVGH